MKNLALLSCFYIFFIMSCSNSESQKVKADLTFRSISFASAYGADNTQYQELLKNIDSSLQKNKSEYSVDSEEVKLYRYFSKLREYGLLRSPYIFLHLGKDSLMTVYLSEKEYEKVKDLRHIDLIKENKKAVIELFIEKKDSNIFYSDNIVNVFKINGKSRSNIIK